MTESGCLLEGVESEEKRGIKRIRGCGRKEILLCLHLVGHMGMP